MWWTWIWQRHPALCTVLANGCWRNGEQLPRWGPLRSVLGGEPCDIVGEVVLVAPHADQLTLPVSIRHSYLSLYDLCEIGHTLLPRGSAQEYQTPGQAEADTVRVAAMCAWVRLMQCAEYAIHTAVRAPSAWTCIHCSGSGVSTCPGRRHAPTQSALMCPTAHCWPRPCPTRFSLCPGHTSWQTRQISGLWQWRCLESL